ncbi:hypothetical protein E2C01_016934 [Portunus trituberculatus]|uniref:Uncharacterized protein n=1 Tax=Portunus trituberculatus TaxID=210409 RepID=A0A5B7DSG4_PORTR|nr:hypothetical protein [Portunus trituberculatus]
MVLGRSSTRRAPKHPFTRPQEALRVQEGRSPKRRRLGHDNGVGVDGGEREEEKEEKEENEEEQEEEEEKGDD